MINNISIQNFAILEEMDLNFHNGLTVITGETGAGKSILLHAIRSSLGGKVKGTAVRSGTDKAIVEIEVTLDGEMNTCRRIINKSGRSRAFFNEEPFKEKDYLDRVKSIADFHGQHEQQYIMNRETHIDFLDTFAKLNNDVSKLEDVYQHLVKAENDLDRAIEKQNQASDRKELLAFQLQEIELISPLLGEDETLMADFKILKHADKLLTTANDLNARITEQDNSLYNELADIRKELEEISSIDEQVVPHLISLEEALNALMDTSEGLRKYATQIDHNPEQLERVESRLQEIESLKRKYGGSLETVINYCDEITIELESFKSLINEIDELTESINRFRSDFQQMATKLHELRSNSIQGLCSKIETELALLNIPGASFDVRMDVISSDKSQIEMNGQTVKYGPKGFDQIDFYLSANPGEAAKPLTDVASGGEVSRIMLAIKTIFQKVDPVDTLVFDEIDAGISGIAAEKVADALSNLSSSKQIICVTHLPQIAAKANHHLHISKLQKDGRTKVKIDYLKDEEKVQTIAQLFSGETITPGTLDSAKGLMGGARG
jgi:DNA repair protein RecN (Recombination protein N)